MKKIIAKILLLTMTIAPVAGMLPTMVNAVEVNWVTTNPATSITSSDATLNGTNGDVAATGHSFWASTSTFSTASPTIPSGVYSTPDMGPIAANTSFSALLSSLTSKL